MSAWCNITTPLPLCRSVAGRRGAVFPLSFSQCIHSGHNVSGSPWIPRRRVGVCSSAAGVVLTRPDSCCFSLFKWTLWPLATTGAALCKVAPRALPLLHGATTSLGADDYVPLTFTMKYHPLIIGIPSHFSPLRRDLLI